MSSEKSEWPGVSTRLNHQSRNGKDIAEAETEMPRSCSIFMKSERVRRASPLARTWPAIWMAPP